MRAVLAVKHRAPQNLVDDLRVLLRRRRREWLRAARGASRNPRASRCSCARRRRAIRRCSVSPEMEISSRPSAPWTTNARRTPSSPSARAIKLRQARFVHADDLRGSSRRIGERAEQIEHGAHAQFAARGHGVARGGVHGRRKKKSDADFFDGCGHALRRQIDAHAEMFEHVRRAAARTDRAVAVLRHAHARARHHERRRGRNVECARSVAAGAAGIDQRFDRRRGGLPGKIGVAWRRIAVAKPTSSSTVSPFMRSAVSKPGDLRVAGAAGEDLFHRGFGFHAREIFFARQFFRALRGSYCFRGETFDGERQSRLARSARSK